MVLSNEHEISVFDFLGLYSGFVIVGKKRSITTLASTKVTCQAECSSYRNLTIRNYQKKSKFRSYRYAAARLQQYSC
jgi:hypothetical protein